MKPFIKEFTSYDEAFEYMVKQNGAVEKAWYETDTLCVVPGPDNKYCVVDIDTALGMDTGYVWSASSTQFINNPWE